MKGWKDQLRMLLLHPLFFILVGKWLLAVSIDKGSTPQGYSYAGYTNIGICFLWVGLWKFYTNGFHLIPAFSQPPLGSLFLWSTKARLHITAIGLWVTPMQISDLWSVDPILQFNPIRTVTGLVFYVVIDILEALSFLISYFQLTFWI